jgi:glycine oxidase
MRLDGLRVLVAGAGAIGSATALRLQLDGARTILADPAALGDNASGVAAGMLAPAFEAALDAASAGHFPLLADARDLWPAFAARLEALGGAIDRSGALWVGEDEASNAAMLIRLQARGARSAALTSAQAQALSPGLAAPAGAILAADDWRLEAGRMLLAMDRAFRDLGGERLQTALRRIEPGAAILEGGAKVAVDHVVIATGMSPHGLAEPPPELSRLEPIKGQIARIEAAGPRGGPVVRAPGVYVVPGEQGCLIGATMEAGRPDRAVEPETLDRLRGLAAPLFPALEGAPVAGAAGVRASTPDALPLVGPSSRSGVTLALGARRNGWLLAPLLAEIVRAQLAGASPPVWAAGLDPLRRFSPPA